MPAKVPADSVSGPSMARPLCERRTRLSEPVDAMDTERLIASLGLAGRGQELFGLVEDQGLEGVMAKRRDGRYLPGRRSWLWPKILNPVRRAQGP